MRPRGEDDRGSHRSDPGDLEQRRRRAAPDQPRHSFVIRAQLFIELVDAAGKANSFFTSDHRLERLVPFPPTGDGVA